MSKNINNDDLSREIGPVILLLPQEKVIKVIESLKKSIFNKLNQHVWFTVGGNKKVFVNTTLRMRVNSSLMVFNL